MKWLLQQVKLYEPNHALHLQTCDVLIENGIIQAITSEVKAEKATVVDGRNCWLSIGFMDIGVQIGEPGLEHREDLNTVTAAAAAGGYTAIAAFPNTLPVIQSKSGIQFLKNYSTQQLVDVLPIGAVTHKTEGEDLTEMYDMAQSGAVAFSDGGQAIQNAGVLLRAMQYVKAFQGIIIHHPNEQHIAGEGQIHEGSVSTQLGLKGIPSLAEELMLQRDIELLDYANTRLHVYMVSTTESVSILKRAKERGLKITASTSPLHLTTTHEALSEFNAQLKVLPPLREEKDRVALLNGIEQGVIDCITSAHVPLEQEKKFLEFSYADFGAIGLETALSICLQVLSPEQLITILAYQNRKALKQTIPTIAVGEVANITLFDPELEWTVTESSLHSKSKNTPFLGKQLKGKVQLTMNRGKVWRE